MVFNSLEFIVFLGVTLIAYYCAPDRSRAPLLLAASCVFYAFAGVIFLAQVLAAGLWSYMCALAIEAAAEKAEKQRALWIGLAVLALNLLAFKYTSFLNESLRGVLGWAGLRYDAPIVKIALPLGISFYTFLLCGYLIDVFRGQKAERSVVATLLFVTFFPKMVAGPIERGRLFFPQVAKLPGFSYEAATAGLSLMLWGAFQKVVVADRLAPFVSAVYEAPEGAFGGPGVAFATWLYAFQIYFDFSGYTLMALGAARLFGIALTPNFNRPYFAVSISDFWKRWHISLSSWLTDYVYTPLTRSRWTRLKLYTLMLVSLMATFLLSGLWHGAEWSFVVWGALHGGYIVVSQLLQKPWNKFAKNSGLTKAPRLYRALKITVTFSLVCFAYIFFRAGSVPHALDLASRLVSGWGNAVAEIKTIVGGEKAPILIALCGAAIGLAPDFFQDRAKVGARIAALPTIGRWGLTYAGAVAVALLGAYYGASQEFIYFKF